MLLFVQLLLSFLGMAVIEEEAAAIIGG